MRVILKILSNQSLMEFVFKNSEYVAKVITPTLKSLTEHMIKRQQEHDESRGLSSHHQHDSAFQIDFPQWIETFEGLSTASFLLDLKGKGSQDQ